MSSRSRSKYADEMFGSTGTGAVPSCGYLVAQRSPFGGGSILTSPFVASSFWIRSQSLVWYPLLASLLIETNKIFHHLIAMPQHDLLVG